MFDVLAAAVIAMSSHQSTPVDTTTVVCQYEDANTDGTACVWTDPDTGRQYYVDSSNYWVDGVAPAGATDLTYCPADEVWSRTFHQCPPV